VESVDRKLIRASFAEAKKKKERKMKPPPRPFSGPKKSAPPDQTNAENFYYLKQINSKTPMVFVLRDGETIEGVIEWYDKASLRILREGRPAMLVYKEGIKYMYKAEQSA
jgi:host factor-I protein